MSRSMGKFRRAGRLRLHDQIALTHEFNDCSLFEQHAGLTCMFL
jgi:hypothetical protein